MVTLSVVIAVGTVIESRYHTELAKIIIYQAWWFEVLLGLLWLNIFCATLSRYPYKKHHIGFVITHIGLLTLIIGSFVTSRFGIDGTLAVSEGEASNLVVLSELNLSHNNSDYTFNKNWFGFKNKKLSEQIYIEEFIPFAKEEVTYVASDQANSGTAVGFLLRNQIFNIGEMLHSKFQPVINLGPATVRLFEGLPSANKSQATSAGKILILDRKTQKSISQILLSDLKKSPQRFADIEFTLKKSYSRAIVGKSGLFEGSNNFNPAVELSVKKSNSTLREVLFANFPDFSVNENGVFGYALQYHNSAADDSQFTQGAVIDFFVDSQISTQATVQLKKNGQILQEQILKTGESIQTPWMGIQVFLGQILANSKSHSVVKRAELEIKKPLYPAAIKIKTPENNSVWLFEGDSFENILFDKKQIRLPFLLHLNKFSKKDYLGTQTPMSFESTVQVDQLPESHLISMNEPLEHMGYTIYQASYQLNPGQPATSVFSVNKDPGRSIKYLGSLILSIGIITYTLMKSRSLRKKAQT